MVLSHLVYLISTLVTLRLPIVCPLQLCFLRQGPIPVLIIVTLALAGFLAHTDCSTLFDEFYVYYCNKIWAKFPFCGVTRIGRINIGHWIDLFLFFSERQKHHTKSSLWDIPLDMVSLCIHRYLLDRSTWSQCIEPKHVVEWNASLFSILLALGGIEFILCLIQVINGVLGGICGYCCTHHQVRTSLKIS